VIIFATIFGVGFLVLIINLIFGGDGDTDIDADGHLGGPNIFSIRMLSLLMVGFGAIGFGARSTTDWSMFVCSMAGIGGAILTGTAGWLILRAFYSSQASSLIEDSDVVGRMANLIDSIGENSNGQVACVIRGREITFLARSHDGQPIDRSKPVQIMSKTGNIVTVKPVSQ
jgi:membrane-bound ClpP family serine protease